MLLLSKLCIDNAVDKGSILCTHEATVYQGISGYRHLMVNHSVDEFVNGMASTKGIESVWAVLKCGFMGTFHHFSKKYIYRYINEFTFRLNEGNVKNHIMQRLNDLILGLFNIKD